jgi:hypothetical protein
MMATHGACMRTQAGESSAIRPMPHLGWIIRASAGVCPVSASSTSRWIEASALITQSARRSSQSITVMDPPFSMPGRSPEESSNSKSDSPMGRMIARIEPGRVPSTAELNSRTASPFLMAWPLTFNLSILVQHPFGQENCMDDRRRISPFQGLVRGFDPRIPESPTRFRMA